MTGGEILVSLESTPKTILLEEILTNNQRPLSISGSLEFWDVNKLSRIRTLEWTEAYIYSVEETMQSGSSMPMMITIGITPLRLDINHHIRIDRRFSTTYGFWWEKYEPEEEVPIFRPTPPEPLVRAVEGPSSGYWNQKLKYKVTEYSVSPTEADREKIKWKVKVDNNETALPQHGEKIELALRPEWLNKTITVMAYLKTPNPRVSVETKVKKFREIFFAKSDSDAGYTADREIAEDMRYGDKTAEEVLEINKNFKKQLDASDDELFASMYRLVKFLSLKEGGSNARKLVDHFRSNKGDTYSSTYMDEKLKNHPTFEKFIYETKGPDKSGTGVLQLLCNLLRDNNGDLDKIELQVGEIGSTRVKFNTRADKLNGMTISVDDTSAYRVYIDNFIFINNNTFNCKIRVEIFDHYGLDKADVEKYGIYNGFRAWYVLQHVRGYKPFLTCLTCVIPIKNQTF